MTAFDLGREFDVVTCLFSSIAYVRTRTGFTRPPPRWRGTSRPAGLLSSSRGSCPSSGTPDLVGAVFVDEPELKVARMNAHGVEPVGDVLVMDFQYLVGTPARRRALHRAHEVGMFTKEHYLDARRGAGLAPSWDDEGLMGRGLCSVRVARSYVARGLAPGRAEARAHPAGDRAAGARAPGRGDRAEVPRAARAARLGDALGADDRRDRQPRHGVALPEVPPARGLPRGSARRARARHPPDGHVPAEGAQPPGRDAMLHRGFDGEVPTRLDDLVRLPGVGRKTANVVVVRARRAARGSSSTLTSGGSRSGSASRARRIP